MRFADEQELSFSMERFTGINQSLEGNDTPMHMSRDAANCDTSGGVLRMARGWAVDTAIAAAPGPIRSLMNFYKNNADGSVTTKLLAATDTGLWQWANNAWQDIAGSQPVTSGRFSHVNYQNKDKAMILLANGTDNVYCWSGEGKIGKLAADAAWVTGMPAWSVNANTVRLTNHGLKEDNEVVFEKLKGKLPTNIVENDTYFVYDDKPDSFRVSATKNGGAVNLKGEGAVGWRVAKAKWLGEGSIAVTSANTITLTNHGLMTDDEIVFDVFSGSMPSNIKRNKSYYAVVLSANTFQVSNTKNDPNDLVTFAASNYGDWRVRKGLPTTWLNGRIAASAKTSTFMLTNHGLKDLDGNKRPTAVEFGIDPAAVLPGGIAAGTTYYVRVVDANNFKLAKTTDAGSPIVDITSAGVPGWAMRRLNADEWMATVPTAINLSTNALTMVAHGFGNGDALVFGIADENSYLPDGLYAGHTYYVKYIDTNKFKLAATPGADQPIDLLSAGMSGWAVKKLGAASWLGIPAVDIGINEITIANHQLHDGDAVVLGLNEARMLPGGLSVGQTYYIRDYTATSFRLAASPGGGAVNLTSVGLNGWRIRAANGMWKATAPRYDIASDKITLSNHGFHNGDAVVVDIPNLNGFMPGGIIAHDGTPYGKFYYVVKATDSTFQVAETPGGTPVKLTSDGTNAFRVRLSRENRPMGCSLALHAERVWCAGERTRPNSAFFSDDMNPTNWAIGTDSAGEIVRPTWDGDAVTAVANLFDSIVVFKGKSVFRVAGTTPGDYQVVPVLSTAGTLSPLSICQWQNGAFFLSPLGIMAYDGTRCELLGSDAMSAFWTRLNRSAAALAGACGTVHRGRLLMALPVDGSMTNNAVVEFDIGQGSYMVREGVAVSAWLPGDTLRFASGNQVCVWGGEDALTYGGQPISMRWVTPETDFGDRSAWKTVTGALVTGKGGRLRLTAKTQGKETGKVIDLPSTGGTVKAPLRLRGRTLSLMIENVEGSAVELTGLTMLYEREDGQ